MGYSTDFSGKLSIYPELTSSQIVSLKKILGEDCRDHPEWDAGDLTYIDLQFTDEMDALEWDGSEKTYELVEKVNLVIKLMRQTVPNFTLSGELFAEGESHDDKWFLRMVDNKAITVAYVPKGKIVVCPHCDKSFEVEFNV